MGGTVDDFLMHYGVKGMRWGIRKSEVPASVPGPISREGITINRDGSFKIEKGAVIQRLVRSNGKSLPLKDITYASINAYDDARYIKAIGGKGVFGGGRDQILKIEATKVIKAPPVSEATRIISEKILTDEKYRNDLSVVIGGPIRQKDLDEIRADPAGKTAQTFYHAANASLTFDASSLKEISNVQAVFRETFLGRGFNAVRDENDALSLSKSPVIIFSPETSLRVVSTTTITDTVRRANKEQLKLYKEQGKAWLDRELYVDL